jgi:hypothetical protein
VNWLPGELESAESKIVKTKIGSFSVGPEAVKEKNVWLGFRPEHMGFSEEAFSEIPNHFRSDLKNTIFLGDQFTFDAMAGDCKLVGKSRMAPKLQENKLHVVVNPDDIMVFPANDLNTKFIESSMANA